MKTQIKNLLASLLFLFFVGSCKLADVRTDLMLSSGITEESKAKGRELLEESIQAMGYQNFSSVRTFETTAKFDWRFPWKTMPLHSFPGARNKEMRFHFQAGAFDGYAEYLEGRKKGNIYGLQSWETYQIKDGKAIEKTNDKARSWGLATFHYILETPYRLLNADIITYAGTREFEGQTYDLVFVSWQEAAPHDEHDQWLLYINTETKFIDLSNLTIRDFFAPFPKNLAEGTVRFIERVETEPGMMLPSNIVIQLQSPKKEKRHVYRLVFEDYSFDTFPVGELKPFEGLKEYGDSKPISK